MNKINFVRIIDYRGVTETDNLKANAGQERHTFLCQPCFIEKGGYLILDFGKELCGRLHIKFGWMDNSGKVRIRLGESVAETCAELGEKNAGNHHSLRDNEYHTVPWGDISTSESGFRFVRIDSLDELSVLTVVFAEEISNGLTIKGDFRCSDERLNDIYKVAERTLSLCVREDDIWDGIKRDRVFWMGDFYPELIGAYLLYGDIPQLEKALRGIKQFEGRWVNSIPSYSAWWIICLEKYYDLSANKAFADEMMPYLDKVVKDYSVIVEENGEVSYKNSKLEYFPANEFFIDWPTNYTADSEIGWRYLLAYAMQKAKRLYGLFGRKNETVNTILERLDKYDYKPSEFKQVTALGVLAEKIDKDEAVRRLKHNGAEGMTCFMGFAIIEALRIAGEGEYALELIKDYFGKMLDLGATTFWEDFDVDWLKDNPLPIDALPDEARKNIHADYGKFCYMGLRHSLCHGWSSGFIDIFYGYVLGVTQTAPGYKQIKVEPHMCGLSCVEGEIPTSYGIIRVKHTLSGGQINTEISVPDGIDIAKK